LIVREGYIYNYNEAFERYIRVNPYTYSVNENEFKLIPENAGNGCLRYSAEFVSAYETPFPEINSARGIYIQPRHNGKVPLVILLHGIGGKGVTPCRMLARNLVKHGYACFVLYQPFHSSRMTADMKRRFPFLTAEEWYEHYRVSVINTRQVMDWVELRPEIDAGKIALFGLSLGGFISAITMGIDNRASAGVLATTGGNSTKISQLSPRWTKHGFHQTEEEYIKLLELYRQYLADAAREGVEAVTPPVQSFLTDPLTYAPQLRGRPLQMFNALWDEAIPRAATLDFWEACGKPEITWLPATHATIWVWYPLISRRILRFLQGVFNR
jgi:predicted esterase